MENNKENEDYITITVDNVEKNSSGRHGRSNNLKRRKKSRMGGKRDNKDKKPRKKWSKKKKIIVITSVILVIFLTIGIVFGVYLFKSKGDIAEAVINMATDIVGNDNPIFVLVLGVSEDIKTELTDTIILCGYNPESQKAFMISIPRDTFIGKSEASAGGYDKINALYKKDVTKTVDAVEKLTGITIDNYVVVKNTALPAIVNAIGSVEFDVPIDMDYDDPTQDLHIHLKAGVQKIDGEKAEQLLRFRHNNDGSSYPSSYGDNDYGRMRTQREFISAVANQLVKNGNTSNLKNIANAVFQNLVTDMSVGKAIGYIPYAIKFDVNNIRMEQLPGSSAMLNNLWFYKASSSQTKELMNELINELELDEKEIEKYYKFKVTKVDTTKKKENTVDIDQPVKETKTKNTVKENTNTITPNKPEKNTNKVENNKPTNTTTNIHEHKYTNITITKPATCTTSGEKTLTCSCGDKKVETIKPKGHSYSNGVCSICKNPDPNYKPEPESKPEPEPEPNPDPEERPEPEPEPNPDPDQGQNTPESGGTEQQENTI